MLFTPKGCDPSKQWGSSKHRDEVLADGWLLEEVRYGTRRGFLIRVIWATVRATVLCGSGKVRVHDDN